MARLTLLASTALAAALLASLPALADDPATCSEVRMSDPGWTDITSTTSIASILLEALGYEPSSEILSVAVSFESMKNGDVDVFLGNWMPGQTEMLNTYLAEKAVEVVAVNLADAKVTLAVNRAAFEGGVKDFADLAAHADKFESTIYSIEPGSSANAHLHTIIDTNDFGLGGWTLEESSEQAMLSQVDRAERRGEWVAFLGWAPHPMNVKYEMDYLSGGDKYFGPNYGGATVQTVARTGYLEACPNLARFFEQLVFSLDAENQMMVLILDEGLDGPAAARQWLGEHPEALAPWLEGVTTLDGKPGLEAVTAALAG
jgi:glycine betaine/proline transport system substrate-binding protein